MISKLKNLGLNEYEIKAYKTLLEYGPLSGGDISKKSGVPHGRVFWALSKLLEKNFINVIGENPKIFSPISPEFAINNFANKKIDDINKNKEEILQEIKDIKKPESKKSISEKIHILAGRKARYSLNEYFFKEVKKEINYIFTYEERPYSLHRLYKEAVNKGIKIRLITTLINEKNIKLIKEDIKIGVEIKYYPVDEIRLQIMDNKESRITIINPRDKNDRTTIYFQHSNLSKHLNNYFKAIWAKSKKINLNSKAKDFP